MSRNLLEALLRREELSGREVDRLVGLLIDPARSDVERAALLVALRAKGESVGEIAAFARALRARATPFPGPRAAGAVDLCGSGGATRPSFNVGTVGAFVVRAAGVPVAKHGNRSARGAEGGWAGSSDLLEALGLPFLSSREYATASFERERITFLHAPLYHPATRAVIPVRRALGVPTVFNWIGPLTNPAAVRYQLVGCPTPAIAGHARPGAPSPRRRAGGHGLRERWHRRAFADSPFAPHLLFARSSDHTPYRSNAAPRCGRSAWPMGTPSRRPSGPRDRTYPRRGGREPSGGRTPDERRRAVGPRHRPHAFGRGQPSDASARLR